MAISAAFVLLVNSQVCKTNAADNAINCNLEIKKLKKIEDPLVLHN